MDIAIMGWSLSTLGAAVIYGTPTGVVTIIFVKNVYGYPISAYSLAFLTAFFGFLVWKKWYFEAPFALLLVAVGYDATTSIVETISPYGGGGPYVWGITWISWLVMLAVSLLSLRKHLRSFKFYAFSVLCIGIIAWWPPPDFTGVLRLLLQLPVEAVACLGVYFSLRRGIPIN